MDVGTLGGEMRIFLFSLMVGCGGAELTDHTTAALADYTVDQVNGGSPGCPDCVVQHPNRVEIYGHPTTGGTIIIDSEVYGQIGRQTYRITPQTGAWRRELAGLPGHIVGVWMESKTLIRYSICEGSAEHCWRTPPTYSQTATLTSAGL